MGQESFCKGWRVTNRPFWNSSLGIPADWTMYYGLHSMDPLTARTTKPLTAELEGLWIPHSSGYGSLTARTMEPLKDRTMDPSQIRLWSPSQIGLWNPLQLSWKVYEALTDRTIDGAPHRSDYGSHTARTMQPSQLGQRSPSQIGLWSPSQLSCSTGRVPQQLRPLCRVSCWQGRFLDKYILQYRQI